MSAVRRRGFNFQLLLLALLALLAGFSLAFKLQQHYQQQRLPEFLLPKLSDGVRVSNAELPVDGFVLNFWASWCLSCRDEHPLLLDLSADGVDVVGVNFRDNDTRARNWLQELGDPYLYSLVDRDGDFEDTHLAIIYLPQTFFVDARGRIAYRRVGPLTAEHLAMGLAALE